MVETQKMTLKEFEKRVSLILQNRPFNWSKQDADKYSLEFEEMFNEGYLPAEAVYEDASYWD